jgi:glycine amidinotransferase
MTQPVVSSYNEWDPLEEIVVGILDGMAQECWEPGRQAGVPLDFLDANRQTCIRYAGRPKSEAVPEGAIELAKQDLDGFVRLLESEGVIVKRPELIDHTRPVMTPDWTSPGGRTSSVPRDVLIVLGDVILEAPMSWRSRYFEFIPYHNLCKEYFRRGAKWVAAPKPRMTDALYNWDYKRGEEYVLTEHESVFDAADMTRCGKDIFIQLSNVTNRSGVEWLERHYGDKYTFHPLLFADDRAVHIDCTFVPLAPGKLLVNPDRPIKEMPAMFAKAGWDILECPRTLMSPSDPKFKWGKWFHMNCLNLDEKRVIVEQSEEPFIRALKSWGLEPIPCSFRNFYPFGGSFHCATLDIRRRGTLQSYF